MASIMKVLKKPNIFKLNGASGYQFIRLHWNKDWMPGPYPETAAEREAAAKKYGLLPSEYEPYPDDGMGHGDYPKLPDESGDSKSSYYPWDFPEHKRNFNEPLHVNADIYGEDRYNVNIKPRYSLLFQLCVFLGIMGGSAALFYFFEDKKMFRPVVPKQYYEQGKVHYTFEPSD